MTNPKDGANAPKPASQFYLPLSLVKSGASMLSLGVLYGFSVPVLPYRILGRSVHAHAITQGVTLISAGILLQTTLPSIEPKSVTSRPLRLFDRLSTRQSRTIYWAAASIWLTLLAEGFNAVWGTRLMFPVGAALEGIDPNGPVVWWQEMVMTLSHIPSAFLQGSMWPIIAYELFTGKA